MSSTDQSSSGLRVRSGRWNLASGGSAEFLVSNFGWKKVRGRIPVDRSEVLVTTNGCSVHTELDMTGVDTGNARRDADLAKPKLLDSSQFPVMAFDAADLSAVPGTQLVRGILAAHGHSVQLDLQVALEQQADDVLSVRATTEFDRIDLGIRAPSFMIGRRVGVEVNVTFRRVS